MPEYPNQTVGEKLKELRVNAGLTLKQVAEKTQLSISFLSQVERGRTTLGSSTMARVASFFQVPIAHFYPPPPNMGDPVIHSFERPYLQISSGFVQYCLSKDLEQTSLRPSIIELMPCSEEEQLSTLFCHPNEEFIYVLEGVLTLRIENNLYTLFPHDSIHVKPNAEHAWCNKTNNITRLISL